MDHGEHYLLRSRLSRVTVELASIRRRAAVDLENGTWGWTAVVFEIVYQNLKRPTLVNKSNDFLYKSLLIVVR